MSVRKDFLETDKDLIADTNSDNKIKFFEAMQSGNIEVVKLLLRRSETKVNLLDYDGNTGICSAIIHARYSRKNRTRYIEIIKYLLERYDWDVNKQSKFGRTALDCAVVERDSEIVELLMKRDDLDINKQNKDGQTPLQFAACHGYHKIVKLLLLYPKIKVNMLTKCGQTAMQLAKGPRTKSLIGEFIKNRNKKTGLICAGLNYGAILYRFVGSNLNLTSAATVIIPKDITKMIYKFAQI